MEVSLKPEQERMIEEWVAAGRFSSTEDAVGAALALLRIEDDLPWDDELMEKVRVGAEQLDRGEGVSYAVGEAESFVEDVRRRAEAKPAEKPGLRGNLSGAV